MILSLKVFDLKKFFIYLLIFFSTFFSIFYIQQKNTSAVYELHNLSFIYMNYVSNNSYTTKIEKYKPVLKRVFPLIDTDKDNNIAENIVVDNETNSKQAINSLMKILFENIDFFISYKTNYIFQEFKYQDDFMWLDIRNNPIVEQDLLSRNNLVICDNYYNNEFISQMVYFSPDYSSNKFVKIIYNPFLNCLLSIFILLFGLLTRKKFFVWSFFIYNSIFLITLIFMPFFRYFYFYSYIFGTWVIFLISIILIIEKFTLKKE